MFKPPPLRWGHARVEMLGKGQIQVLRRRASASLWTPAVKLPVKERERNDHVEPNHGADPQKLSRRVRFGSAPDDIDRQDAVQSGSNIARDPSTTGSQ